MILSIVIPVFGVERFIKDCIESCLANISNNESEVEIIIVNDGSKDHSMEIVRELVGKSPYVHVINQENQGLSMARNNGLEKAIGDYVWFVDSDDFIAPGIVNEIILKISQFEDIDMIELNYEEVDEFVEKSSVYHDVNVCSVKKIISGQERLFNGFYSPVPFHVFRRKFLDDYSLRMYPGIYHEDGEFTPRALWMAKKVVDIDCTAYYYRQRKNSIMTTVNPKKGADNMFVSFRLKDFFDNQEMKNYERKIVNNFISMVYCNGLHNAIGASGEDRKLLETSAFENRCVLENLRKSTKLKYRVLGYLASIFPNHIIQIYLLMMKFNKK